MFSHRALAVDVRGMRLRVAIVERLGPGDTLLYAHGLGSSPMDLVRLAPFPALDQLSLVAFGWPGCAGSEYPRGRSLDVDDLVDVLHQVLGALDLSRGTGRPTLVGHSVGGLVGLLYLRRFQDGRIGFVNVEGNLAPEDCIMSRPVVAASAAQVPPTVLDELIEALSRSGKAGFSAFAEELPRNLSGRVLVDYCRSIVSYSDGRPLLEWFVSLPNDRVFVYGSENSGLSYLPTLRAAGIPTARIAASNHFPALTNPRQLGRAIGQFVRERGRPRCDEARAES